MMSCSMKISLLQTSELSWLDIEEAYLLNSLVFEDLHRDRFEERLRAWDWVACCYEPGSGELLGFSPFSLRSLPPSPGQTSAVQALVIDTAAAVIDPALNLQRVLVPLWVGLIHGLPSTSVPPSSLKSNERTPFKLPSLYWLLLCDSPWSYRFLSSLCREFYPRLQSQSAAHSAYPPAPGSRSSELPPLAPLPSFLWDALPQPISQGYDQTQPILPALGRCYRRSCYEIPLSLSSPQARFFTQQNPGYRRGDRLMCWATLTPENLKPLAQRRWARHPLTQACIQRFQTQNLGAKTPGSSVSALAYPECQSFG